jgi:dihydroorotase
MMELCTPLIKKGGCDIVYVMPNLQPPITQVSQAVSYHEKLSQIAPDVTFLMSLFLHPGLDAAAIAEAARSKVIYGVNIHFSIQTFQSLMYSVVN